MVEGFARHDFFEWCLANINEIVPIGFQEGLSYEQSGID